MYCKKCGSKRTGGKCPVCDTEQKVSNSIHELYVFVGTIASLIIIRLMTQQRIETPSTTSWKPGEMNVEYPVPDNIKGVMAVLLGASVFILWGIYSSGKCNKVNTILYLIAELIIGYYIITFI